MKKWIPAGLLALCLIVAPACNSGGGDNGGNGNDGNEKPPVTADDGKEMEKEGYIYYEDFTKRTEVPSYLEKTVAGLGRVQIEDGALRMTVINGGSGDHAFMNYTFKETLSGKVTVEMKIKADASPFINALFFFGDTQDFFSTSEVVTNVAMDGGNFKNNSGSGWTSAGIKYDTGEWYGVKMAIDTDGGYYNLTVNDAVKTNLPFRKKNTAIKHLRFGSQTAWADVSYEYIKIRPAVDEDFDVSETGFNYENDFGGTSKPADLKSEASAGGSVDFSVDGQVTLATPSSGTVSVSKTFDSSLEGVFAAEVRFKNNSSAQNTFANILFLRNSALSGTAGNIITVAVESGKLRYHNGSKWELVQYDSADAEIQNGVWYTLTAVNDTVAKKTVLYISGGGFAGTVRLGEFDFRNKTAGNPDMLELAIGVGKAGTSFTADYIKVYSADKLDI